MALAFYLVEEQIFTLSPFDGTIFFTLERHPDPADSNSIIGIKTNFAS